MAEDFAAALDVRRAPERLPRALSLPRVARLLEESGSPADARRPPDKMRLLDARNAAILETLYSTGMRVSELTGLTLGDLDWDARLVRCVGKGDKERLCPVGEPGGSFVRLLRAPALPSASLLILSATPSQHICLQAGRTFESFRRYSDTLRSPRHRYTRTWTGSG